MPAIAIAATKRIFAKLKIIPPSSAENKLELSACFKSAIKALPPLPLLPSVKANRRDKIRIPNT
jgi:hypothetical protein